MTDVPLTHNPLNGVTAACASAVKYDWLTAYYLERASADQQPAYARQGTMDADARYAARAAGLGRCARWAQEADQLAHALLG